MRILISNDDGIDSPGLRALHAAVLEAGHEAVVVAPASQQSGVSHCLTVFSPLCGREVHEENFSGLAVEGTPADCVNLGLYLNGTALPDLVISGINAGINVGPDVMYSGTIAAAAQSCIAGIPSVAVSDAGSTPQQLRAKARHAVALACGADWAHLPAGRVLNLNYPKGALEDAGGIKICPLTGAVWTNSYEERRSPSGGRYWWLTGEIPAADVEQGSDRDLLLAGFITLTPLVFNCYDGASLDVLRGMQDAGALPKA